jgi:hypothetical protein
MDEEFKVGDTIKILDSMQSSHFKVLAVEKYYLYVQIGWVGKSHVRKVIPPSNQVEIRFRQ